LVLDLGDGPILPPVQRIGHRAQTAVEAPVHGRGGAPERRRPRRDAAEPRGPELLVCQVREGVERERVGRGRAAATSGVDAGVMRGDEGRVVREHGQPRRALLGRGVGLPVLRAPRVEQRLVRPRVPAGASASASASGGCRRGRGGEQQQEKVEDGGHFLAIPPSTALLAPARGGVLRRVWIVRVRIGAVRRRAEKCGEDMATTRRAR